MCVQHLFWLLLSIFPFIHGLDNGLALTPPMGWMTWQRFRCVTDCVNDPDNCISESLIKNMADKMVSEGYKDAGYEYIIIDDCWMDHKRDSQGKLQPDAKRFPSGMKALGDYIHNKGLKFGIYGDYGTHTCGGYPGTLNHLEDDANTFSAWGVDYVKLDGCYVDPAEMDHGYPEFGQWLNKTGRPIVYSCSWPAYQKNPDYASIAEHCNLWRNYADIEDSYGSVLGIMDHFGDIQDIIRKHAGPGSWNDPDMLIIGDFSLSVDQSKTQMAVWAVLAAPLLMSNDLRSILPVYKDILLNKNVIKINQDPNGIQGKRIMHRMGPSKNVDVFLRPIMPIVQNEYSGAVAIVYRGVTGTPVDVILNPKSVGLHNKAGYMVSDAFTGEDLGSVTMNQKIKVRVNPSGARLLRFNVKTNKMLIHEQIVKKMMDTPDIFVVEHVGQTKPKMNKFWWYHY